MSSGCIVRCSGAQWLTGIGVLLARIGRVIDRQTSSDRNIRENQYHRHLSWGQPSVRRLSGGFPAGSGDEAATFREYD
jgi:hypothetical protein